jgi:hypothetical protein
MKHKPKAITPKSERSDGPSFDEESGIVATTRFDELSAELAQLGIDAAAFHAAKPKKQVAMLRRAGVSKDEAAELIGSYREPTPRQRHRQLEEWQKQKQQAEARLREQGLSKSERALVLGRVFDKASARQLETATGWKKTWIAAKLRSPRIKRAIAAIEDFPSGKALPVESESAPSALRDKPGSKAIRLCDVRRCANELFKEQGSLDKTGPSGWWPSSSLCPTSSPETAKKIVSQIRSYPGALLSNDGLFPLTMLVQLLEAANWGVDVAGWCGNAGEAEKRRGKVASDELPYLPYAASGWHRKRVAKAARAILQRLWERNPGDRLEYPPLIVTTLLDGILERVAELQQQWKSFSVGRKESALAPFRENHAEELHDFNDVELRSLLDGDLLPAACRVAQKETGVSAETFTRYHRETLIRLREPPYADGRLAFARLLQESGNKA